MSTPTLRSPDTMNVEDLLAHIAGRFYVVHRQVLPDLIALARKVEHVHKGVPDAPVGLADALESLSLELDMHIQVEEKVLFAAMRQKIGGALSHPIALMRSEHRDYAAELDKLQELAHGFVPPSGACGSWRRLYAGVAELCASLREQIRVENEVLFPRFDVEQTRCICAQG